MTLLATTKNLRLPRRDAAPVTVPKVRLYVEAPEKQGIWYVNIGHVTKRGRWRTEPHAHPDFGQVIFVLKGRGVMNLEGGVEPFEGPCAMLLPTECVHGLDYEVDVDKWVITIDVAYLAQVNSKLPEFLQLWSSPKVISLAHDAEVAAEIQMVIGRLEQENNSKTVGYIVGTEALLTSLFLILVRGTRRDQTVKEVAPPGATRLAARFRELIEQHYRENLPLQKYASMLAVTPTQLRAACAAVTGQSPTKMIHARIITEAKRNLIFGNMSVEQVAYSLGFSDAAYFTRFFRKEVGQCPSDFRTTARRQPQHAA